jgi:Cys-tRNA(Pro)/Cys-tRNA(Cys) deacylase
MSDSVFENIQQQLIERAVPHRYIKHRATKTIQDAQDKLEFDVHCILKTIVFRQKNAGLFLVGLTGHKRIDYKKLALAIGVSRTKLSILAPDEVFENLGIAVGCVSPFLSNEQIPLIVDDDLPEKLICGSGRFDYSVAVSSEDLIAATRAVVAPVHQV